jgi:UDP-N-acetylglucosamine 2-epimerase (non-hydrolysing)
MKITTVLGTRPEIIRLSLIIKKLDKISEHILIDTGQNYTKSLKDVFFCDLNIRKPDLYLGVKANSPGLQIGQILSRMENALVQTRPEKLLILGDTNSGLSSIIAKRLGIPVYHMEAGNRCYDDRVPEEVNRRIIDHCADIHMPYTHRSKENLLREGIPRKNIFVIGNPIYEVLEYYKKGIDLSDILRKLRLEKNKYFLVTMHRAENVDVEERLRRIIEALNLISHHYQLPVLCSLHPRTKSKMKKYHFAFEHQYIKYMNPLGLFDFVALEKNAFCVLTDSGTVQEECCIYSIPNITIRDVTERPETVECGSNIISGDAPQEILKMVDIVIHADKAWMVPSEYKDPVVSDKVIKILFSKNSISC